MQWKRKYKGIIIATQSLWNKIPEFSLQSSSGLPPWEEGAFFLHLPWPGLSREDLTSGDLIYCSILATQVHLAITGQYSAPLWKYQHEILLPSLCPDQLLQREFWESLWVTMNYKIAYWIWTLICSSTFFCFAVVWLWYSEHHFAALVGNSLLAFCSEHLVVTILPCPLITGHKLVLSVPATVNLPHACPEKCHSSPWG